MRHRSGGHFDAEINQQPSQPAQQRYSKTLQQRCNNSGTTLINSPKPVHSGLMCSKHRSNAVVYRSRTKDYAFSSDASSRLCKQAYVNLHNIFLSRISNKPMTKWLFWGNASLTFHHAKYWSQRRKTSLLASTVAATIDKT